MSAGGFSSAADAAPAAAPDRPMYAVLGVRRDATEEEIRRAYRQAAAVYHPDKTRDPARQEDAAAAFSQLQHAYEVLSDPGKRDIYDVYGEEGLEAGMELSDTSGRSRDELRKEWESFRAKRRQQELDASVNYRGVYVFRVDATALVRPYDRRISRMPELSSIYMTSGLDVPFDLSPQSFGAAFGRWAGVMGAERDALHLGGLVSVRRNVGGGSFLAGYKRTWSDYTTIEMHAAVGLKTLLSLQTSVQLSPHASATLAASWQPNLGPGLQFITTRRITERAHGEFSWVIGPKEAAGMTLGLSHRGESFMVSGGVEVGASTGFNLRVVKHLSEKSTGRIAVKIGITGAEIDIGGTRRLSDVATAGLSVVAGTKGILIRVRYSRAGHLFEFPVTLSPTLDPGVLAGVCLIPPAVLYAGTEWVIRPLGAALSSRRSLAERRQRAAEIRQALSQAAATQALLRPVALRRAKKESADGGLVVVLALYGEEGAVKEKDVAYLRRAASALSGSTEAETAASSKGIPTTEETGAPRAHPVEIVQDRDALEEAEIEEEAGPSGTAAAGTPPSLAGGQVGEAAEEQEGVPAAIVDVTLPLQYLAEGGRVVLHKGYSKAHMMGFCDPAPGATKLLVVYYVYGGTARMARVADTDGAVLPARGNPIDDHETAAMVLELAAALSLR